MVRQVEQIGGMNEFGLTIQIVDPSKLAESIRLAKWVSRQDRAGQSSGSVGLSKLEVLDKPIDPDGPIGLGSLIRYSSVGHAGGMSQTKYFI